MKMVVHTYTYDMLNSYMYIHMIIIKYIYIIFDDLLGYIINNT